MELLTLLIIIFITLSVVTIKKLTKRVEITEQFINEYIGLPKKDELQKPNNENVSSINEADTGRHSTSQE